MFNSLKTTRAAYMANFYELYPSTLDVSPMKHQVFLKSLLANSYLELISGTIPFSRVNRIVDEYLKLAAFTPYFCGADVYCLRGVLLGRKEYSVNFSNFIARRFSEEAVTRLYKKLAPEYKAIVSYFVEEQEHNWEESRLLGYYGHYVCKAYKLQKIARGEI